MSEVYPLFTENAALSLRTWPLTRAESVFNTNAGQVIMTGIVAAGLPKQAARVQWLKNVVLADRERGESHESFVRRQRFDPGDTPTLEQVAEEMARRRAMCLQELQVGGYNLDNLGITHRDARLIRDKKPSGDSMLVRPDARLFGVADGVSFGGDDDKASRLVVNRFGESVARQTLLSYRPGGLNEDQQVLWSAAEFTDQRMRYAKTKDELRPGASSTLTAAYLGRMGLTEFNAGDSESLFVNLHTEAFHELSTKQSAGDGPGTYFAGKSSADRPYSTTRTKRKCDEIITYPWDELLQRGQRGVLLHYTDGITGSDGREVVPTELLAGVTQKYRDNLALCARVIVSEIAQRLDDRALVMVGLERPA